MDDRMMAMMRLAARGYSCAQIMVQLALAERGETNPALVRAMAGLAYGGGTGTGTCGALAGACCLLGLYAGKGSDDETEAAQLPLMLDEIGQWFEAKIGRPQGGITCAAITGEEGPAAARVRCGAIVSETYDKVVEILTTHGFDLAGDRPFES
jgi:hypothetical protein